MRNKIWEAPNGWIVKRSFLSKDSVEIADQIMRCKNITWSDLWFLMEVYHFSKWNKTKVLLMLSIYSLMFALVAFLLVIL